MFARVFEMSLMCQSIGEIVMGGRIIGLKLQGRGIMGQRFIGVALLQASEGEGCVRLGQARVQAQRHFASGERLVIAFLI